MFDWLRRIDDAAFSPPHRFETILAFVALQFGLSPENESETHVAPDASPERVQPSADRP